MLATFELIVSLGFLRESGGMAQIDPPKTRMWIYERIQSILRICKLQTHASYPLPAREVPSPLFEEAVYPFIDDPVIPSIISFQSCGVRSHHAPRYQLQCQNCEENGDITKE